MVEVCHNGQWGLVCEHLNSYYTPAAEVVCKQVGIPSRSKFCGPVQGLGGENTPAIFSEVRCTGSEEKLTACCNGRPEDDRCDKAGVTCGKSGGESTELLKIFLLAHYNHYVQ